MRILINDKMQFASGVPAEIISPALSDRYNTSDTFTATFDDAEVVNCIGIGYTDATEIEIRNDNPFDAAVINLPLESDALDVSGNGNNGTATDITWTGGVANFNGMSSKILRSNCLFQYDEMTISFKIKISENKGTYDNVITQGSYNVNGWFVELSNTSMVGVYFNSSGLHSYVSDPVALTLDVWYGYICTLSGGIAKLYRDNVLVATTTGISYTKLTQSLYIGANSSGTVEFKGALSDMNIFNRALTISEIESINNGEMLQTLTLTPRTDVTRKYNNGLYLLNEISTSKFTITHNGNYMGRVGIGEYRTLGTAPSKEIGFYTTTESRETLSGQTIPGAGGYYGRRFIADVRYKFTEEIYNDLETAYQTQIQRSFPYFLLLDDEQHKVPDTMLHFYAASDKPLSLLQSSSYKFLYSYKFNFEERF